MDLKQAARDIRLDTIRCIGSLGAGHYGGSLSIAEVLSVLYFKHMRIDPAQPKLEGRDRLFLSKGHAGPALYAALANRGYFPKAKLLTLNQPGTDLPSHCDMRRTPGVDMTAGSLAQGFSCAVGAALGSRLRQDGAWIYAIIGDGESQEGQIWEAAMFAASRKLDHLIAFLDYNGAQLDGAVNDINTLEPVCAKWEAFGWNCIDVADGHDVDAIDRAVCQAKSSAGRPTMIVLHTVKAKGIAKMEGKAQGSHYFALTPEEVEQALKENGGTDHVDA